MKKLKLNLSDVVPLDDGLWSVGQFFDSADFEYIKQTVLGLDQEAFVQSTASNLRQELTWVNDGILEELTSVDMSGIIELLDNQNIQCNQVRVWRDDPGYMIPFHEDDNVVYAHFQVYIQSLDPYIGTTWYTTKGRHTCAFVPNSGYITICNRRLPHGMLNPVKDSSRYSLYATFRAKYS